MTLPDERYRAIKFAENFLKDLCDRNKTPRVPKAIRGRAYSILRHYPSEYHLSELAKASPDIIQEQMEDVHRFILKGLEKDENRT